MNYINFKRYANSRLDSLKESLIRDVNIPSNPITYDGLKGRYIINPFGSNTYSFDIFFSTEEDLQAFVKEFSKPENEEIQLNSYVKTDGIHKQYVVSGFINKAVLEPIQIEFKDLLNK